MTVTVANVYRITFKQRNCTATIKQDNYTCLYQYCFMV